MAPRVVLHGPCKDEFHRGKRLVISWLETFMAASKFSRPRMCSLRLVVLFEFGALTNCSFLLLVQSLLMTRTVEG
jgi:hypothetical protein